MDMKRDFLAEYSGECLYHHGIMGQKWGVRRFQNKDGSLTEAGHKRYGKPLSKKIQKAEESMDYAKVNRLAKDKNLLKAFDSDEDRKKLRSDLESTSKDFERNKERINKKLWDDGVAEVAKRKEYEYGDAWTDAVMFGLKNAHDYFSKDKEYTKSQKDLESLSKKFEKTSKQFVDGYLGEYGKTPVNNDMAIKYNTKTKEIEKQTLADVLSFEMYRNAGGII